MPRQDPGCNQTLQLKLNASYPRASLEGLPDDIKLKVLKLMGDLPSLRRLRLASQAYYAAARAHRAYLQSLYQEEINIRKHNSDRVPNYRGQQWHGTPEADSALAHLLRDWSVNIAPQLEHPHDPFEGFKLEGKSIPRNEWIARRLFVLIGEHFNRRQVYSHIQVLASRMRERVRRATLQPGDLQLMENILPISRDGFHEDLEKAKAARKEAEGYGWTAAVQNMSGEEIFNLVKKRKAVALVRAVCEAEPSYALDTIHLWLMHEKNGEDMSGINKLMKSLWRSGLPIELPEKKAEEQLPADDFDSEVDHNEELFAKIMSGSHCQSDTEPESASGYESEPGSEFGF